MHKNMRRSIAIAATATGMWALGTAAASADELPVSVPLSTPDLAAETPDATEIVEDVKDTAAVKDVTDSKVLKGAKAVTDAKDAEALKNVRGIDAADGVKDTLTEAGSEAAGATDVRDRLPSQVRAPQTPEVPDLGDVQQVPENVRVPQVPAAPADEIDYLFGPIEQIPGYAQNQAPAAVQGALTEAGPVVGQTSDSVLPPLAAGAVDAALPVVGQAVGDVGTLARGVLGEVGPFAQGVVGDAAVPFAQGVTTEVQPLAEGVGRQVRPFAGGVADTVREDARPAVGHAATGTQGVTSVTPSFVTDALPAQ
ncbi:hypothetical protein ACFCY9_25875 [Streptomyces fimicarius]|uniref:hypothetical protein n=1 Tax=Streptomyces griseus TaxID=1911 RepID=UPI0035D805A8